MITSVIDCALVSYSYYYYAVTVHEFCAILLHRLDLQETASTCASPSIIVYDGGFVLK